MHLYEKPCHKLTAVAIHKTLANENYANIKTDIGWAKSVGAAVAIDNFGVGHSNFKPLLALPIDYIKLDGFLINKVDVEYRHQVVVTSIIELAHQLNVKVVAERVHSESIYNAVKKLGVDYVQGFYLSKPKARPDRINSLIQELESKF